MSMNESVETNGESGEQPTPADLRRAADEGRAAKAENALLTKRLALLEAGVPVKSPVGAMFLETYKGDLTDEAIQAEWAKVMPAAEQAAGSQPVDEEQVRKHLEEEQERSDEQLLREQMGAGGSGQSAAGDPDPIAAGYEEFHRLRKEGRTRQNASQAVIGGIIQAAAKGDDRVIWNGWTDEQMAEAGGKR